MGFVKNGNNVLTDTVEKPKVLCYHEYMDIDKKKKIQMEMFANALRATCHLKSQVGDGDIDGGSDVEQELNKWFAVRLGEVCDAFSDILDNDNGELMTDEENKTMKEFCFSVSAQVSILMSKDGVKYNSIFNNKQLEIMPMGGMGGTRGGNIIIWILIMILLTFLSLFVIDKGHEMENEQLSKFVLKATYAAGETLANKRAEGMPVNQAAIVAAKSAFVTGITEFGWSAAKNKELQQAVKRSVPVHCPSFNIGNDASKDKSALRSLRDFLISGMLMTTQSPGLGAVNNCFFGVSEDFLKEAKRIIITEHNGNYNFFLLMAWMCRGLSTLWTALEYTSSAEDLIRLGSDKVNSKMLSIIITTIVWGVTSYKSVQWYSGGKNKTRKARKSKTRKSKTRKSKTRKSKARKSKARKSKARKMKSTRKRR